jgi:hypothetical protein
VHRPARIGPRATADNAQTDPSTGGVGNAIAQRGRRVDRCRSFLTAHALATMCHSRHAYSGTTFRFDLRSGSEHQSAPHIVASESGEDQIHALQLVRPDSVLAVIVPPA